MSHTPLFRFMRRSMARAARVQPIGRREFMRGASSLATTGALAAPIAACTPPLPADRSGDGPVVIIGAGLSGLTAAWELARRSVPFVVYEASGRIGGRVWTLRDFNAGGQFVELGAELVDTGHDDLRAVCAEVGVAVTKFSLPNEGIANEIFVHRGQIHTGSELAAGLKPLLQAIAVARREIQGKRKDLAVSWNNPQGAAAYDRLSLAAFLDRQREVAGWVREVVRIAYVGEMGREASEQSALNLILLMDPEQPGLYGESDEAWRIAGGSSSLVEGLQQAILRKVGSSADAILRLRHELVAIRNSGSALQLVINQDGSHQAVNASRVIVTLPFSVLRTVDGIGELPLHPVKLRSIRELGYGTNSKLMLDYRQRVWRQQGGRLPPFNGFLTTDAGPQTFWDTSRDQPGDNGVLTNFLGGRAGALLESGNSRLASDYLARIDPRFGQAESGQRRAMNWSRHRWSLGSYSCPLVGQYTSIFGIEGRAELGGRLLFAGEHTSPDYAGFMNGAVESGRRVAREALQPLAAAA